jgi:hypothetical protein
VTNINKDKGSLWQSVRVSVFLAICLFIIDAFLLGTVAIAALATPVIVLWMLPKTLFALNRKDELLIRSMKTCVYTIMVVAVIAAYVGNDRMARNGAEEIVAAVNQYKGDLKQYPVSLNELTPKYLGHIPRAKYTLNYGEYYYRLNEHGQATLMYHVLPPFKRRVYRFAHQNWITID